jgi:hypothetical protein
MKETLLKSKFGSSQQTPCNKDKSISVMDFEPMEPIKIQNYSFENKIENAVSFRPSAEVRSSI